MIERAGRRRMADIGMGPNANESQSAPPRVAGTSHIQVDLHLVHEDDANAKALSQLAERCLQMSIERGPRPALPLL
jgi:hypothetical protein